MPDDNSDLHQLLRPTWVKVLEIVGEDALLELLDNYGGQRVLLPVVSQGDNWLNRALPRHAREVAHLLGWGPGTRYDMPTALYWRLAVLLRRGASVPEMAAKFARTERAIHHMKSHLRKLGLLPLSADEPEGAGSAGKVPYAGKER